MSIFQEYIDPSKIVEKYFINPNKRLLLKQYEILIDQDEVNKRLFYVKSGKLAGYLPDEYISEPIFEATAGSFLGVYSYFSDDHKSYSQVTASQDSEVYFFDDDPGTLADQNERDLLDFLFNIVVLELRARQRFAASMANDRQKAMNKLIQTEKLVTLGQLSAGLAHELNNTIGSFNSNLGRLESFIEELIHKTQNEKEYAAYLRGLQDGLVLTSREERERRKEWTNHGQIDHSLLKKYIRAGITPQEAKTREQATESANLWNMGQVLHDLKIASKQAGHVVSSIKTMGIANQQWSSNVQVNHTIKESMVILKSITKYADFSFELDETIPEIEACHGELVQVWVNLIKNAIENLRHHKVESPTLKITSRHTNHHIEVLVSDNGTGIDESIMSKIYTPSFTTKVEGLSLGLGLGLSIVQRIVSEHYGRILIESKPGETVFKVRLRKRP